MNSSTNKVLPKGVTPNEVQFNRTKTRYIEISKRRKKANKYHLQTTPSIYDNPIQSSSSSNKSISSESEGSSNTNNKELSELY